jgi:hypothetical protein
MRNFNSQDGIFKPILGIKITPEGIPIQNKGHKNVQSRVQGKPIETFYGAIAVEEPVLLELIESSAFQRLKYIHQYCVSYYTTHREEYTRYDAPWKSKSQGFYTTSRTQLFLTLGIGFSTCTIKRAITKIASTEFLLKKADWEAF